MTVSDFTSLGLAEPLMRALAVEGFTTPTPIQAQAIPHGLAGSDLVGIAQTGTGKTAAFALPILHRLLAERRPKQAGGCRALILAPTRELASQIQEVFQTLGRGTSLSSAVVFGGVDGRRQARTMARGVDILVATPGRLMDHIQQRTIQLGQVEVVVLDEVDRMLDIGFIHAVRRIMGMTPRDRQCLFFSATMPREIEALAAELLKSPARVAVAPVATTVERVEQRVIHVETAHKRAMLAGVLADPAVERALVFSRTKHGADKVVRYLEACGIETAAIHGNKSQNQRERALSGFKDGRVKVLIATDIAARGIDVEGVTHVINLDLPEVAETYVHRIGRTARAGAAGIAIAFCASDERPLLRQIEQLTRRRLWVVDPSSVRMIEAKVPAGPARPEAHDERRQPARRPERSLSRQSGSSFASPTRRRGGRSA